MQEIYTVIRESSLICVYSSLTFEYLLSFKFFVSMVIGGDGDFSSFDHFNSRFNTKNSLSCLLLGHANSRAPANMVPASRKASKYAIKKIQNAALSTKNTFDYLFLLNAQLTCN